MTINWTVVALALGAVFIIWLSSSGEDEPEFLYPDGEECVQHSQCKSNVCCFADASAGSNTTCVADATQCFPKINEPCSCASGVNPCTDASCAGGKVCCQTVDVGKTVCVENPNQCQTLEGQACSDNDPPCAAGLKCCQGKEDETFSCRREPDCKGIAPTFQCNETSECQDGLTCCRQWWDVSPGALKYCFHDPSYCGGRNGEDCSPHPGETSHGWCIDENAMCCNGICKDRSECQQAEGGFCQSYTDCANGMRCCNNKCRPFCLTGETCSHYSECSPDEGCIGGVCQPEPCTGPNGVCEGEDRYCCEPAGQSYGDKGGFCLTGGCRVGEKTYQKQVYGDMDIKDCRSKTACKMQQEFDSLPTSDEGWYLICRPEGTKCPHGVPCSSDETTPCEGTCCGLKTDNDWYFVGECSPFKCELIDVCYDSANCASGICKYSDELGHKVCQKSW